MFKVNNFPLLLLLALAIISINSMFVSYAQAFDKVDEDYQQTSYPAYDSTRHLYRPQLVELLEALNLLARDMPILTQHNLHQAIQVMSNNDDVNSDDDLNERQLVAGTTNSISAQNQANYEADMKAKRKQASNSFARQQQTGELLNRQLISSTNNNKKKKMKKMASQNNDSIDNTFERNRQIEDRFDTSASKRMESSRWNNLRGMWGKRGYSFTAN